MISGLELLAKQDYCLEKRLDTVGEIIPFCKSAPLLFAGDYGNQ